MAQVISTLFIAADGVAEIDPAWHFPYFDDAMGQAVRLFVHPVAARKGRKLFDDGDRPYHLAVKATEVFPTGVIRVS